MFYRRKHAEESDPTHRNVFSNPSFQYENGNHADSEYDATTEVGLPTGIAVYHEPTPVVQGGAGVVYDSASFAVPQTRTVDMNGSQDGYLHVDGDESNIVRAAENPLYEPAHATGAPRAVLLRDDLEDDEDLSI